MINTDNQERSTREIVNLPGGIKDSMPIGSIWQALEELTLHGAPQFSYVLVVGHDVWADYADPESNTNIVHRVYAIELFGVEERVSRFWFARNELIDRWWERCFVRVM